MTTMSKQCYVYLIDPLRPDDEASYYVNAYAMDTPGWVPVQGHHMVSFTPLTADEAAQKGVEQLIQKREKLLDDIKKVDETIKKFQALAFTHYREV